MSGLENPILLRMSETGIAWVMARVVASATCSSADFLTLRPQDVWDKVRIYLLPIFVSIYYSILRARCGVIGMQGFELSTRDVQPDNGVQDPPLYQPVQSIDSSDWYPINLIHVNKDMLLITLILTTTSESRTYCGPIGQNPLPATGAAVPYGFAVFRPLSWMITWRLAAPVQHRLRGSEALFADSIRLGR